MQSIYGPLRPQHGYGVSAATAHLMPISQSWSMSDRHSDVSFLKIPLLLVGGGFAGAIGKKYIVPLAVDNAVSFAAGLGSVFRGKILRGKSAKSIMTTLGLSSAVFYHKTKRSLHDSADLIKAGLDPERDIVWDPHRNKLTFSNWFYDDIFDIFTIEEQDFAPHQGLPEVVGPVIPQNPPPPLHQASYEGPVSTPSPKASDGLKRCPPGHYWNGRRCVKR